MDEGFDVATDARIAAFGSLVDAYRRLMRVFDHTLRAEYGMTSVAFEAMLRLSRSEDRRLSMSVLAEQMVLTSGGVTRLVDRLVDAGFVERVQCPTDRRVLWAELTDRGLELVTAAAMRHALDVEDRYTGEMTADELRQVTAVLDRLARSCPGQPAVRTQNQSSTSSMATSLDSVSAHSSSASDPATIPHPA